MESPPHLFLVRLRLRLRFAAAGGICGGGGGHGGGRSKLLLHERSDASSRDDAWFLLV